MNNKSQAKIFQVFLISLLLISGFFIYFVMAAESDWTIEGDSVYIDDTNVYINITPHTSNQPVIEFKSKVYTGDIDFVVGFNTSKVVPRKAEYNPQLINITKSYTCNDFFNYTLSPNYAWCYDNVTTYDNITNESLYHLELVFEHSFDTGNISLKTIYWEEEEVVWNDVSEAFSSVDIDFLGYDKWYYIQGFPITEDELYELKLSLQSKSINEPSHKYFFGVKPSGETLQEAIANGHFYYIDPWTEGLNSGLVSYYKMDEVSGNLVDSVGPYSGINDGAEQGVTGKINNSYDFEETETDSVNISNSSVKDQNVGSISIWYKTEDLDGTEVLVCESNYDTGDTFHYLVLNPDATLQWVGAGAWVYTVPTSSLNNEWQHIVLTSNGSVTSFYVNGSLITKSITLGSDGMWFNDKAGALLTLGVLSRPAPAYYFDGLMDEIGFWNRTLSAEEVTQLYNDGDGITYGDYGEYNLTITDPTTASPKSVSSLDNITVTFNFTQGGDNLTSGVIVKNVTIGGSEASILTSSVCEGTLDCIQYSTEATCNNCSECSWSGGSVPTFVSAGAIVIDFVQAVSMTPTCPAHQANDILVVAAGSDIANDLSTSTDGWAEIANLGGSNLDAVWFWKRAPGAGTAGPTITASDDDGFAICYVIRGAITDATPFEDATTAGDLVDNNPDTAEITTTASNRFVVSLLSVQEDTAWSSAPPPAGWTSDSDLATASGNDFRFTFISKEEASATTVSAVQIGTQTASEKWGSLTLAFISTSSCSNDGDCSTCALGECDTNCSTGGCSIGTTNQTWYTAGTGWRTNVTVPTFASGLKDLFINASDGTNYAWNTNTEAIDYGSGGEDTCTYTSGNWEVDCSDDCVISSPVDLGGYNISIIGTGTFKTTAAITNYKKLYIKGTDSSNICRVTCDGGCFND